MPRLIGQFGAAWKSDGRPNRARSATDAIVRGDEASSLQDHDENFEPRGY
jgi:hypothetical protein